MLGSSYVALKEFQSQISSVKNFQELKDLSETLGVSISTQIYSSTVWVACWDITLGKVQGTIEIGIQPKLSTKSEVFEIRSPRTLRLEQPGFIDFTILEFQLLDLIKQAFLNISTLKL